MFGSRHVWDGPPASRRWGTPGRGRGRHGRSEITIPFEDGLTGRAAGLEPVNAGSSPAPRATSSVLGVRRCNAGLAGARPVRRAVGACRAWPGPASGRRRDIPPERTPDTRRPSGAGAGRHSLGVAQWRACLATNQEVGGSIPLTQASRAGWCDKSALEVYRRAHLPVEQKAAGSTPVGGAGARAPNAVAIVQRSGRAGVDRATPVRIRLVTLLGRGVMAAWLTPNQLVRVRVLAPMPACGEGGWRHRPEELDGRATASRAVCSELESPLWHSRQLAKRERTGLQLRHEWVRLPHWRPAGPIGPHRHLCP